MNITELLTQLKSENISHPYRKIWWDIFLRLSIYIKGIKPNYDIVNDDNYRNSSYRRIDENEPYTEIFNNEIFCRYPHDSSAQLNFRKSIAHIDDMKSLCDKFFEQSKSIIFQGNNFTVNTEDAVLKEWIDKVRIDGFDFYEWVKNALYTKLFNDPNAIVCVMEAHKELLLPSERAMPMPVIVESSEIRYYDDFFLVVKGYAFDKLSQFILDKDQFITGRIYPHSMNELPCLQLGGKYVSRKVWHSFIQSFVGIANSYIQEKSDVSIAKKTLAPRLQIISTMCPQCNGSGSIDTEEGKKSCTSCAGKGKISINLGDIVDVPETTAVMDDGRLANIDRFKYTTPDPKYIELLNADANTEFTRAEKALFIYRKETSASESANNLDKQFEEKKIFFQSISERLYYVIYEVVRFASMYLNYNNGNPKPSVFTIDKPIDFDLNTASDVLLQYENETKNKLPLTITNLTELNYVKKVFGDNSMMFKKMEFLQLYDPLYGKGSEYVSTTQGISEMAIATHNYLANKLELYIIEITQDVYLKQPHAKTWEALKPEIESEISNLPTLM